MSANPLTQSGNCGTNGNEKPWERCKKLFVYGTLLVEDVYRRVVSRHDAHTKYVEAILVGWQRRHVIDQTYPAIVPVEGHVVRGAIVEPLEADWQKLDEWEDFEYKRIITTVTLLDTKEEGECWVYVWNEPLNRLDERDWSLETFLARDLQQCQATIPTNISN